MDMERKFHAFSQICNEPSRQLKTQVVVSCNGRFAMTTGIWDTGATQSCVSEDIVQALCLTCNKRQLMLSPFGDKEVGVYSVDIGLPREIMFHNIEVVSSEIGK